MKCRILLPFLFLALILTVSVINISAKNSDPYIEIRQEMVRDQIQSRGVSDPEVLNAMKKVPRHEFVPGNLKFLSYYDGPLEIGEDQTISQPYIVAYMTELLELKPGEKVLEIGTGSGYQAAVLAEITDQVYTIEILKPLYDSAQEKLRELGYRNVQMKLGDGSLGWPEHAPFDKIIVTAAALNDVPQPLIDQMKEGGLIVIPVGEFYQELIVGVKKNGKLEKTIKIPVRFVPLLEGNEAKKVTDGHS